MMAKRGNLNGVCLFWNDTLTCRYTYLAMGCICGRPKKKNDTPVSLPLEGREITEWPERTLERPERTPELPARPFRPPPMNHC